MEVLVFYHSKRLKIRDPEKRQKSIVGFSLRSGRVTDRTDDKRKSEIITEINKTNPGRIISRNTGARLWRLIFYRRKLKQIFTNNA